MANRMTGRLAVAVERVGKRFQVVMLYSRLPLTKADLEAMGFPDERPGRMTKTEAEAMADQIDGQVAERMRRRKR